MIKQFTDMHLIAALMSYKFEPSDVDATDRNRQKYKFPTDQERPVYILQGGQVREVTVNVVDAEKHYSAERLMFLPSYPSKLRTTKYSIISKKHEED